MDLETKSGFEEGRELKRGGRRDKERQGGRQERWQVEGG